MTSSRLLQAATSAGTAAIAALALAFGVQVILFDNDVRRFEAAAAVPTPGTRTQWVTVAEPAARTNNGAALAGWRATPGVGGAARTLIATRGEFSLPHRLLEITNALSVAPTNGAQWAAFADATLRLGYGAEHAIRAYDMAALTARREGDQMYARTLIVLGAWEQMPDDRRRAAMAGLADLRWQLKGSELRTIVELVAAKSPQVRTEIREALPTKWRGDKRFHKAVGL